MHFRHIAFGHLGTTIAPSAVKSCTAVVMDISSCHRPHSPACFLSSIISDHHHAGIQVPKRQLSSSLNRVVLLFASRTFARISHTISLMCRNSVQTLLVVRFHSLGFPSLLNNCTLQIQQKIKVCEGRSFSTERIPQPVRQQRSLIVI